MIARTRDEIIRDAAIAALWQTLDDLFDEVARAPLSIDIVREKITEAWEYSALAGTKTPASLAQSIAMTCPVRRPRLPAVLEALGEEAPR